MGEYALPQLPRHRHRTIRLPRARLPTHTRGQMRFLRPHHSGPRAGPRRGRSPNWAGDGRLLQPPAKTCEVEMRIADDRSMRPPTAAGRFYPAAASVLGRLVESFLEAAQVDANAAPKAIIAPHAGYTFSGPVAGSAFRPWALRGQGLNRIAVLGPSHWVDFEGIALPRATNFSTPLGNVPLDLEAVERLRDLPQVFEFDAAHEYEHCIEAELPFLQAFLPRFSIVPLVIGEATDQQVCELIDRLWGGPETGFVISSDLSHYHDYDTARRIDAATAKHIEQARASELSAELACGFRPLRGFLLCACSRGIAATTIDLRNSGDTAGSRDRVVGYGAFYFLESDRLVSPEIVARQCGVTVRSPSSAKLGGAVAP